MTRAGGLSIDRVNPLEHEREIKALFSQEGSDGAFFAPFFDRAYREAVADGAWSWIARDEAGALVMHMGCFPHRYSVDDRVLRGGLGVNLMVAPEHRALLPALALLRRLIADARELGFDFLYSDPNERGRAALKLAGFGVLGNLERFVLPLAGRTVSESVAVGGLRLWRSAKPSTWSAFAREWDGAVFDADAWNSVPISGRIVPQHPAMIFRRRLVNYPSPQHRWLTDASSVAESSVALLIEGPDELGMASIWDIRRRTDTPLTRIIAGAADVMRGVGAARLQASSLAESTLAEELCESGMVPRRDLTPVMLLPLTDAGAAAAREPARWHITQLDCDR